MATLFAKRAYIQFEWFDNVRIHITDGKISSWEASTTKMLDEDLADIVIPGIPNTHSHVFQRALVGHCERKSPANKDDFWNWRSNMYKLAEKLSPTTLKTIARQAYAEMLSAGYTTVAEFHYVHRSNNGHHEAKEMFDAIAEAANDVGIRVVYLPILYERSGFEQIPLNKTQMLFNLNYDDFVKHFEYAKENESYCLNVGVGIHSLRAVSKTTLCRLATQAHSENCPIHIHVAEQIAEVEQCIEFYGNSPINWLLDNVHVNCNWCLVHATHAEDDELARVAKSQAVICLCPTTEANLGDGIFSFPCWLNLGGALAIGSDSQVSIDPLEELRWLEYGQRLLLRTRNISTLKPNTHTGETLFRKAVQGGNRACGVQNAALDVGSNADLITFREDNAILAGHGSNTILDTLIFSGNSHVVDRVMVAGKWVVQDGKHNKSATLEREYANCVSKLWN